MVYPSFRIKCVITQKVQALRKIKHTTPFHSVEELCAMGYYLLLHGNMGTAFKEEKNNVMNNGVPPKCFAYKYCHVINICIYITYDILYISFTDHCGEVQAGYQCIPFLENAC